MGTRGREAEGKGEGRGYEEEEKVRDRVHRGDDRRGPRKKDVQGRRMSKIKVHAEDLMEICSQSEFHPLKCV